MYGLSSLFHQFSLSDFSSETIEQTYGINSVIHQNGERILYFLINELNKKERIVHYCVCSEQLNGYICIGYWMLESQWCVKCTHAEKVVIYFFRYLVTKCL